MNTSGPGGLKRHSFHLGNQDLAALKIIQDRMGLPSAALAIRVSLRNLARRLEANKPPTPDEPDPGVSAETGEPCAH
jgi:hypothetical protein